ncbi:MAG: GerW family sporulation protein [Firmicutes bacterium]|nr:GerW family sporulation protein [Bacillota bacterium]MDY3658987.1 GerW family sporulation protein [Eubacteriales bacterium]
MKIYERTSTLDNLIEKTLSSLQSISTTKTIFGEPTILPDGTSIVPVSKVTIGFVVGGGEYSDLSTRRVATHYPMAGGSGGGVMLTPIGFLVTSGGEVKYVSTMAEQNFQKIMEMLAKASQKIAKTMSKKGEEK